MTYRYYPDGFGEVTGTDPLSYADKIYVTADGTADVYFVDSATGNDTTGTGTRSNPYATIAKAFTVAGNFDVIFVRAGHEETFTTTQTVSTSVIIIGEGEGDDRPLLTPSVPSNGNMWTVSAGAVIRNLRFAASTIATTGYIIDSSWPNRISYCEFDSGQHNDNWIVRMTTSGGFLYACEFIASGTSTSTRPYGSVSGSEWAIGCTFTGGTYGWQNAVSLVNWWDNTATGPIGISVTGFCQVQLSGDAYFTGTGSVTADGLGRLGHPLIANPGLCVGSGLSIAWVDSTNPNNGDTASHGSVDKPYATLTYAINTAASTSLFVVNAGHTESITAKILLDQARGMIVGVGTGVNRPLFTRAFNGTAMELNLSSTNGMIANIRFAVSTVSSSLDRVTAAGTAPLIHNVEFKCGSNDAGSSVLQGDGSMLLGCSFISEVTYSAPAPAQPAAALASAPYTVGHSVVDCTFDGGGYGWILGRAINMSGFEAFYENLTLLRDSAVYLAEVGGYATGFDAFVQVGTTTGASTVTIV